MFDPRTDRTVELMVESPGLVGSVDDSDERRSERQTGDDLLEHVHLLR